MDGAATFNLPFPLSDRVITRNNAKHEHTRACEPEVWMNAKVIVVPRPYYAVTDQNGRFELADVRLETMKWVLGTKDGMCWAGRMR